jgi:hypothetical protein
MDQRQSKKDLNSDSSDKIQSEFQIWVTNIENLSEEVIREAFKKHGSGILFRFASVQVREISFLISLILCSFAS